MRRTNQELENTTCIHQGVHFLIYRQDVSGFAKPVVIKIPQEKRTGDRETEALNNEYTLTKDITESGIRRAIELTDISGSPALILDYVEGQTLAETFAGQPGPIIDILRIAAGIAKALDAIHRRNIIHGNINSKNILVNPATGRITLIDFGLATTFDQRLGYFAAPDISSGRLPYISPEQTGRMNRSVDYRTDLYSLGIVIYEMLTGSPPFVADEALELVHAHIAKTPKPLRDVRPDIPATIADIIAKLLAKNAEDRYQSAAGVQTDLEACLAYLDSHRGRKDPQSLSLTLGKNDVPTTFRIPQKLYGRSKEMAALLVAFDRVAAGRCELMIVSGHPGVGKSALVAEIHKPITAKRGYFISGKFDQYLHNIPYAAFTDALNRFFEILPLEDENEVGALREDILSALGANGAVLTEFLPHLEKLIGPQPPVPELTGKQRRIRFNLTFRKFMQALGASHHPLVFFIDDWQWADSGSLELLKVIFSGETTGRLLLILAYRDNEISPTHPLTIALKEIEKTGAGLNAIELLPLTETDTHALIADSLNCTQEAAEPLARTIYSITRGNPFFNHQFLKALYDERAIRFDGKIGFWSYDAEKIRMLDLPGDVAVFMVSRLQKLPPMTQTVLATASCIGGAFDLETLALGRQKSLSQTAADLKHALQEGLILQSEEGRDYPIYRFIHDRVQQAAYSLIPDEQKQKTHLTIGRLMLANFRQTQLTDRIFEIVNQLNRAADLQTQVGERLELSRLNMIAGQKAKAASAFASAWNYFETALNLLPENSWDTHYPITRSLHEAGIEAAYFSGDSCAANALIEVILRRAQVLIDMARAYEIKILILGGENRFKEAIDAGMKFLALLEIDVPENIDAFDIQTAIGDATSFYRGKQIEDLAGLPVTTDPIQLAAMRTLESLSGAAYLSSPKLYIWIILKRMELIIRHGNFPSSPLCYSSFGALLCGRTEDIETGYRFGQLAVGMLQGMNTHELYCRTTCLVDGFINHWKTPVHTTLAPLRSAYYSGLETGELEFAAYSIILYCGYAFYAGTEKDMAEFEAEMSGFSQTLRQLKLMSIFHYLQMVRQSVHDLREGRPDARYLQGEDYDENIMLPRHNEARDQNGLFYLNAYKLLRNYLYGDYAQAVFDADQAEAYYGSIAALAHMPIFLFFDSLARLAYGRTNPAADQDALIVKVNANQEKLSFWAQHAPMNCQYKYDLVEAEKERLSGSPWTAADHFERAIKGAEENGYLRDRAIACQLAAEFYLEQGRDKVAAPYILEAYSDYRRYGATTVAAGLHARYAGLSAFPQIAELTKRFTSSALASPEDTPSHLDLATVIKATHAIASEMDLGELLKKMMRIAIENAGAQRGVLILEKDGRWVIEAQGDVDQSDVQVLMERPITTGEAASPEIVAHVIRSQDSLVLDNATESGSFTHDAYVINHQVKSVICMPLVNQTKISGILYLENNRAADAFSARRLELLNMVSMQMALSLDNARLYQKARKEITERKKAEEAIKEEQEYSRMILDQVAVPIVISRTADGKMLYVNPALAEVARMNRKALIDRSTRDFYAHPGDRVKLLEIIERQGFVDNFETQLLHGDGTPYWVLDSARKITYRGEPYLLSSYIDITNRKEDQAQIDRNLRVTRMRLQISQALAGKESEEEVLDVLNRQFNIYPEADASIGTLEWLDSEAVITIRRIAESLADTEVPMPVGSRLSASQFKMIEEFIACDTYISNNLSTDERFSPVDRDILIRYGLSSFGAFQIKAGDQLLGFIFATARTCDFFDEEKQLICATLAEQGAIALRTVRLIEAIRSSRQRLSFLIQQSPLAIIEWDLEFRVVEWNSAAERIFGYTLQEALGHPAADLIIPEAARPQVNRIWADLRADQGGAYSINENITRDGSIISCEWYNAPIFDVVGKISGAVSVVQNITERKQAETEKARLQEQLNQAQKMESIGRLAGGIAHDFNNILSGIIGYSELIAMRADDITQKYVSHILQASERARNLIKQILAFSRRVEQDRKPMDFRTVVKEAFKLLRATISTTIDMRISHPDLPVMVDADYTQMHQVLMNICTNAAHAMGGKGGILDVQLTTEHIDSELHQDHLNLPSGLYAKLVISDTGHGIDPAHLPLLFDPFFTTKKTGEGTGLGLAVVYGIVHNHAGSITVSSRPGQGATFTVYLPVIDDMAASFDRSAAKIIPRGHERILLVDDEAELVELGHQILSSLGYRVTGCTESSEALRVYSAAPNSFDLVITDMNMPTVSGSELSMEILKLRKDQPIMICTGYSDYMDSEKSAQIGIREFVMKPLTRESLATLVRKVLDSPKPSAPSE